MVGVFETQEKQRREREKKKEKKKRKKNMEKKREKGKTERFCLPLCVFAVCSSLAAFASIFFLVYTRKKNKKKFFFFFMVFSFLKEMRIFLLVLLVALCVQETFALKKAFKKSEF